MSEFLISTLRTLAPFFTLMAFTALCLAFVAVRIGRRETPSADPFSEPFGEMAPFPPEQLLRMASNMRLEDPVNRTYATRRIDPVIDGDREPICLGYGRPFFSRHVGLTNISELPHVDDNGGDRRFLDFSNSPSAGDALRSADAGSVGLLPSGPDAARLDPRDVFASCWRRPRGGY